MAKPTEVMKIPAGALPKRAIVEQAEKFLRKFKTTEVDNGLTPLLHLDQKSNAYYVVCHLPARVIIANADTDAVLDPDESDEYKFNRNIYTDTFAYRLMERDAGEKRTFEDIVVEYDLSYRPNLPLKIFGGQHRVNAIREAGKKHQNVSHGVRVYFDLDRSQKLDIATVNNTSIAVSNDLLDRMQEDVLGAELRSWCQSIGLLKANQNFADKRSPEGVPTVRIVRSVLVNFYEGIRNKTAESHNPIVCASGPGIDKHYQALRRRIDWSDAALSKTGEEFARLHLSQRKKVLGRNENNFIEFANKAIHPAVASAWAYASGLLQDDVSALAVHYGLPDSVADEKPDDPLNATALLHARLKGVDPDSYRGLGARISGGELGRMLEVFLLQATKATRRGITPKLANAAIQSYEAKKAHAAAEWAVKGI
jgi:hypothetical protein